MKLPTDPAAILEARTTAANFAHTVTGRFTRVPMGLSLENRCSACGAYVVVTPRWAPWEPVLYYGPAVTGACRKMGASL